MELNHEYKQGFLRQVERSMDADFYASLPNPLKRINKLFNFMQSRYILITGSTGSGKTSFVDYSAILGVWSLIKEEPDLLEDMHLEYLYFSLERKRMFKHAKWVSYMIYRDHGIRVSADELIGWGDKPLNDKGYKLLRSYDDEISKLLGHCTIYDGKVKVDFVKKRIAEKAKELGTLFTSDNKRVYKEGSHIGFFSEDLVRTTERGKELYYKFTHNGREYEILQNSRVYVPHKLSTFFFIVVDGINLYRDKKDIDDLSIALADARDIYGFSPIVVTQQNRSLGDSTRQKMRGAELEPQLEDIYGTSQLSFDADVIAAIFDPLNYKAYDTKGYYAGYDILNGTMDPKGFSRFRSLHILKNSFGPDNKAFGMKFVGESNYFETLPHPAKLQELAEVYSRIAGGNA